MTIIVIGVEGSGKSTIGRMLAATLNWRFLDADSLHSAETIRKMAGGVPLTDADRAPWLAAIRDQIEITYRNGGNLVVACSALKSSYRTLLASRTPVIWVYLKGNQDSIRARLEQRREHFAKANMLASQFAILEEPANAIVVDVSLPPQEMVNQVLAQLRRQTTEPHAA
jgi:gluconokinase